MLRDAMEETGLFTVELACNGHEVLERIHTHEPELLVLDPALPGTDGIRVLRQLRREGCGYIHDAALLALDDPSLLHAVTKVIYPCVARRNGTTAFCVERAIRHAIEITWERGSRDAWDRYFGHLCADGGKPANGMFLAELVEALKYEKLG